jgi:hypothetical protein
MFLIWSMFIIGDLVFTHRESAWKLPPHNHTLPLRPSIEQPVLQLPPRLARAIVAAQATAC